MSKIDILIIGAGPVGLFTVFEAGLLNMRCHIIDSLPRPGGQLIELYPNKPIFDIPGIPEISASKLIDNLTKQIKQFCPVYSLCETAISYKKESDASFTVTTNLGNKINVNAIIIAAGLGTFYPRKPDIQNISKFEGKGVDYFIKDYNIFKDKNIVIAGGGDSALDWVYFLHNKCKNVTLIHRRSEFRGSADTLLKISRLKDKGLINILAPCDIISLKLCPNNDHLNSITVSNNGYKLDLKCDFLLPMYGLIPKLGPLLNWGLHIEKGSILVNNSLDYMTNIDKIYAVGDVNIYPGKLKLILSGFHEATLACQSIYKKLNPDKKYILKYTTVTGVKGFDGTLKEAKKNIIKEL